MHRKRTWWQKLTRSIELSGKLVTEIDHYVLESLRSNPWKVLDENKEWQQLCFETKLIPVEKIRKIKNAFGVFPVFCFQLSLRHYTILYTTPVELQETNYLTTQFIVHEFFPCLIIPCR